MAAGADHYKTAEDLLFDQVYPLHDDEPELALLAALVHAVLALYRATADVTTEVHDLNVARESRKAV